MKPSPVASVQERARSAASLLHFYRDALDKLALWRLTERDPTMQDAMREVADDLLGRCALLTRKMRAAGLLNEVEKMAGLRLVVNRADNRPSQEPR